MTDVCGDAFWMIRSGGGRAQDCEAVQSGNALELAFLPSGGWCKFRSLLVPAEAPSSASLCARRDRRRRIRVTWPRLQPTRRILARHAYKRFALCRVSADYARMKPVCGRPFRLEDDDVTWASRRSLDAIECSACRRGGSTGPASVGRGTRPPFHVKHDWARVLRKFADATSAPLVCRVVCPQKLTAGAMVRINASGEAW